MVTSTGLQAFLSNLCRNATDHGRIARAPPLLHPDSSPTRPLTSSDLGGDGDDDDTNKSFSLLFLTVFFSGESSAFWFEQGGGNLRQTSVPPRVRSIRRVLRRRRLMIGLVVGLRVGLLGMEHWVAKSLNLWSVAICFVDLRSDRWNGMCVFLVLVIVRG